MCSYPYEVTTCSDMDSNARTSFKLVVEGNIGAGKTTLIRTLERAFADLSVSFETFAEPLELYQSASSSRSNGREVDVLSLMNSGANVAVSFRLLAMAGHWRNAIKARSSLVPSAVHIFERELNTVRKVFGDHRREETLPDDQIVAIDLIYDMVSETIPEADAFIYVNTSPDTCLARVVQRARVGESNYNIEYLRELDVYYRNLIVEEAAAGKSVYIIDNAGDRDEANERARECAKAILSSLNVTYDDKMARRDGNKKKNKPKPAARRRDGSSLPPLRHSHRK